MKAKLLSLTLTLALAGAARADFNPVPLTPGSYTYDVVIASNAVQINPQVYPYYFITATTGSGTDLFGDDTYFEQGYYARAGTSGGIFGVPVHNSTFTDLNNPNCVFLMPPTYLTNNTLQVDSINTTGTFTLTVPTNVTSLALLSGGAGQGDITYSVNHQTGSPETGILTLQDWYSGATEIAWGTDGRVDVFNDFDINDYSLTDNSGVPYLYAYYITGISSASPVCSITITWSTVNEGNFWAVSGSSDGTTYAPIPVTGFNQICIVPAPIPYPITATMDNGADLTGGNYNTWYEQGFDTNDPTTGLPPSGSTFSSLSQPTHYFQMGNYTTNCAILIDANHVSNNIVPLNPQPYDGFAFLTAGGNVVSGNQMTNICIVQHLGGINETHIFIGYDWFESSVAPAYIAHGLYNVDFDSPYNNYGLDDLGTNSSYPELFETYFALSDTVDPVTNIIVLFDTVPASQPNASTFIMAVSATSSPLAPFIGGPTPTNQNWLVGQVATFTASVGGSFPLTNFWEVEKNGVFVPLTDGPDGHGSYIYGSQTGTLTISNLTLADATNYLLVATNGVGGAIGGPVSLTATPLTILGQFPPASVSSLSVFTNLPTEFEVIVNGAASAPVAYQWYRGVPQTPANAIPGATNAIYTLSNLYGVTLSCIVANPLGALTSSPVAILLKAPFASPAPYQAAIFSYHPVAYWPLNETRGNVAYDLVGNNNGSYLGSCVLGQPGVSSAEHLGTNFSVGFDGATAYVDIPVNNLNFTNSVTLIQWIQTTGESANTDYYDDYFATTVGHGDNSYRLDVDGGGNAHFADSGPDATSANSVADGYWHQLVGVFDGTNQYIYVDGSLQTTQFEGSAPKGDATLDVWIGGAPDYGTDASNTNDDRIFYGNICQVAILTNALSASQVAALFNAAGLAPVITSDLQPSYAVYAGLPLTLSVAAYGSGTLAYQWTSNSVNLVDGGGISGSQSNVLTIASVGPRDNATYQLTVTNAFGSASSVAATVTATPVLGFNGNGTGWSLNSYNSQDGYQGSANTLQLTSDDPYGQEDTSSFFEKPVYVGGFVATFNYQDVTIGGADGIAFVVQNDYRGAGALGAQGGSLGFCGYYNGIAPSVGAEINIYDQNTVGYNFQTSPTNPATFLSTAPVDPSSGDLINVTVTYLAGTMTMTLVDSAASTTFTTAPYSADIPTLLGTNLAYVGFTGADGGIMSKQQVSDFTYVPIVSLTAATTSGNNLVLTWPTMIGGYVLEQTRSLAAPNWVPATATYSVVNGLNQAVVPVNGAGNFYRLHLTY